MRSPGFSKIASWRTSGRALAFILLWGAFPLGAQGLDLAVETRGGFVSADLVFRWDRESELVSTLRDGLESRITFTVRLLRVQPSLLPFLGETLMVEKSVSRSAFYDVLEQKFTMESEDGKRALFAHPEDLVRDYLRLAVPRLAASGGPGRQAVTGRVHFEAVRLMPPLGIVSFAGAAASYLSPWVRKEVGTP